MYNFVSGFKGYFIREMVIDNPIFRIHCHVTAVMLFAFASIITWTQVLGGPIKCVVYGIPQHVINTYCWIMSTFLMPDAFLRPSTSVAYPGVDVTNSEAGQKYYTYYQWVCIVLFFQSFMCYFPKWLWQTWENNLMSTIVCGLDIGLHTEECKSKKKSILIDYLIRHLNQHKMYAFRYWFCEVLCLVNVILQMFAMDWFFQGDFMSYGLKVLTFDSMDQNQRYDHMVYVFPRVTKCIFRKVGHSGTIETRDALCVIPLNIVNEKTYIFLWFWFIILAILTSVVLVFRVIMIIAPSLRPKLMHARNRMVPKKAVESVSRKVGIGDWWVLYMLARNVDPHIYRDVIVELSKKIETSSSKNLKILKRNDS